MKLPTWTRTLSPASWLLSALAAALVVFAAWWVATSPQRAADTAATAKAGGVVAGAGDRASAAATEAVAAQGERQAEREDLTRNNRDAILNAPGASAPVDPGVADAGLRARCLRDAYKNHPSCAGLRQAGSAPTR